MLKSVLQYYKLGKTEGFCMFYVLHVVLRVCYGPAGCRSVVESADSTAAVLRRCYVYYMAGALGRFSS